jgi:hypothetical protein
MKVPAKVVARAPWMATVAFLAACSGGGDSAVTVNGDVPIAYAKRVASVTLNPLNGAPTAPGGDLMVRDKSSPSAIIIIIFLSYNINYSSLENLTLLYHI